MKGPHTLQEAIIHFADPENCLRYMVAHRWPNGVFCPTCGRADVSWLPNQRKWQCKSAHAKRQFSAKVGTIFEDSPLGLEKWLPAVWLIASAKNGVSSCEIARSLGVTQKTAWFMMHRIRKAMQDGSFVKLGGNGGGAIEADETFIGGKVSNMHKSKRERLGGKRRGVTGKTIVVGMLERNGRVKADVVIERTQEVLHALAAKNLAPGSTLISDEWGGYKGTDFIHEVVNHAEEYVRGQVHINGIENFWSLLKRSLNGTYVSVEPFHLFRYLDEQVFRFNHRATKKNPRNDLDRFSAVLSQVAGHRVTYAELTGKVGTTPF